MQTQVVWRSRLLISFSWKRKKIAMVLGDMFELGSDSIDEHQAIVDFT
jgi:UDP-N-acetylmuramyl pentapeptide synthase